MQPWLRPAAEPVSSISIHKHNLSLHLGIRADDNTTTAYDLLLDPSMDACDALVYVEPNLHVLPAETDLAAVEADLASETDKHLRLRRVFEQFTDFDVIMIDCPPSLGVLTLNALAASTEVLVPLQAHFLALQGVGKLLETVGMIGRGVNPTLRVGAIALCMHEGHTTLAREVVDDLKNFLENAREKDVPWSDCRLLEPPVRRNVKPRRGAFVRPVDLHLRQLVPWRRGLPTPCDVGARHVGAATPRRHRCERTHRQRRCLTCFWRRLQLIYVHGALPSPRPSSW